MSRTIDLNADLGEGFPWDRPLLDRVTSASIGCGAHAGDLRTMHESIRWARDRGVVVGAHPGYPDREGFGRRELSLKPDEVRDLVRRQVDDLAVVADDLDATIHFVKPHGALYNQAQRDWAVAGAILEALGSRPNLPILGQPGSVLERLAIERGTPFIAEGFADRRYLPDGRLAPRSEPGAVLDDPDSIRKQVLFLAGRGIRTLCIHGDDPRSVGLADLVLATLRDAGIGPRSFA